MIIAAKSRSISNINPLLHFARNCVTTWRGSPRDETEQTIQKVENEGSSFNNGRNHNMPTISSGKSISQSTGASKLADHSSGLDPVGSSFSYSELSSASAPKQSRGLWRLGVYAMLNLIPIGTGIWIFRSLSDSNAIEELDLENTDAVVAHADQIIKTNSGCFCIRQRDDGSCTTVMVYPHYPEQSPLQFEDRSKEDPTGLLTTSPILADVFSIRRSNFSLPLNFIHFSFPGSYALDETSKLTLLYYNQLQNAYVTLRGVAVVVTDDHYRRFYWKSSWAAIYGADATYEKEESKVRNLQEQTKTTRVNSKRQPSWILLKFIPEEVDIQFCGGGDRHWKLYTLRRTYNPVDDSITWCTVGR